MTLRPYLGHCHVNDKRLKQWIYIHMLVRSLGIKEFLSRKCFPIYDEEFLYLSTLWCIWRRVNPRGGGGALPVMAYKGYLFHASCIWKVGISRVEVNENERVGKSELWSYCFNLLNAAWKWQENLLFGGCTKGVPFLSKMVYKGKGSGLRAEHN